MYVVRRDNKIAGVFCLPNELATEFLPDDSQELTDYFNPPTSVQDYENAIQKHIDDYAKTKNYADGVSFASYKDSTIGAWSTEATKFIAWRDQVWYYAYTELAKVQNGVRPQPSIEMFLLELPQIGA